MREEDSGEGYSGSVVVHEWDGVCVGGVCVWVLYNYFMMGSF